MPYVVSGRHRVFYRRTGEEGPPLIFLHGAWLDHAMWDKQQRYFSAAFRTVAYDLGCHGQSRFPAGWKCRVPQWAAELNMLIEALFPGERVYVCGLSLGGMIAMYWAHHHPDRVRGLLIVDSPIDFSVPWWAAPFYYALSYLLWVLLQLLPFRWLIGLFFRTLQPMLSPKQRASGGAFTQYVRQSFERMGKKRWFAVWKAAMQYRGLSRYQPPPATGLILGEHDHWFVRWKMRTFARRHQLPLTIIPKAAHVANIENPAEFNATAAAFLKQHPA